MSKGGGYFLRFKGKGIVIDPGFNFIDNFKGAGHSFNEIDVVMITHAHNDHTSDLESILTLLHKYNDKQKGYEDYESEDTIRADLAEDKGCPIGEIEPEEIDEAFENSPRRKIIDLYITQSVEKKFSGMLNLRSKENYNCHTIERGDEKKLLNGTLRVKVLEAKHDDLLSDRDSVGFLFFFDKTALLYTGDTGWSDGIEKEYKKLLRSLKNKHLVLLAHLGGFKKRESGYLTGDKPLEDCLYKSHLGRLGLVKLVQTLKPSVCIVSEFGEELRGHREELTEIFEQIFAGETRFLPGDIGLEYHLLEQQVRAISELDMDKNTFKTHLTDPKDVATWMLRKDHSLHYYDRDAGVKEGDLAQVLIEQFDRSTG